MRLYSSRVRHWFPRGRRGFVAGSALLVLTISIPAGGGGDAVGAVRHGAAPNIVTAANLWVGPGGRPSCVRAAIALEYAAALAGGNVCDTGPTAYSRATLGDTVLIEGGTYTSQWNFRPSITKTGATGTCNYNYGGAPNLSGCITFMPAQGQTVVIQVASSGQPQVRVCANFVSIRNVTIAETDYVDSYGDTVSNASIGVGRGDSTCQPNGGPPHDLYFANVNYGGQAGAVGGAYNVWFVGGAATSTKNFPWQMGGQGNNGATSYANHNGIVGMTFQGYNFANTDSAHHHMECIHDSPGSDHITLAGSRLLGCPTESFYAEGTSQTNLLIENNYFDSSSPMVIGCDSNGCDFSNIIIRFNSFHGGGWRPEVVGATNTNFGGGQFYGNLGDNVCKTYGIHNPTTGGFTSRYNVATNTQIGICVGDSTSSYGATVSYVSPGFPNWDLDLLGPTQMADCFVPASVSRAATDIHGNPRPMGSIDAGADER